MKKSVILGLLASLFFACTFIFNRSMNLAGGYWLWSAILRYVFILPILFVILLKQHALKRIIDDIKKKPAAWFIWSTIGFGVFYTFVSVASVYGESWFVAASWQFTIVAGVLLTPLFGKKIPVKNLLFSMMILCGIFVLQAAHFKEMKTTGLLASIIFIVIAGFTYPLGNRKMMQHASPEITTVQRVFGMTLCSMPYWIVCAIVAGVRAVAPSGSQLLQSLIVAVCSGVIGTLLFFEATNRVKMYPKKLAIVEAAQSGEVIFTLIGGILFLGDAIPSPLGFVGIAIIVFGMIFNSLASE